MTPYEREMHNIIDEWYREIFDSPVLNDLFDKYTDEYNRRICEDVVSEKYSDLTDEELDRLGDFCKFVSRKDFEIRTALWESTNKTIIDGETANG